MPPGRADRSVMLRRKRWFDRPRSPASGRPHPRCGCSGPWDTVRREQGMESHEPWPLGPHPLHHRRQRLPGRWRGLAGCPRRSSGWRCALAWRPKAGCSSRWYRATRAPVRLSPLRS